MRDYIEMGHAVRNNLLLVKRKGMKELVEFLDTTDFYVAPASDKYHLAIPYGLLLHSWNVCNAVLRLNDQMDLGLPKESLIIAGYLHDICKVNKYLKDPDGKYTTKEEMKHRGHAALSLSRIKRFIELTPFEDELIRYHMGLFGACDEKYKEYTVEELHTAIKRNKFVQVFAACDMASTMMEDKLDKLDISKTMMLDTIRNFDKGDGVSVERLAIELGVCDINRSDFESKLAKLKEFADVFEPRPGMLKLLE